MAVNITHEYEFYEVLNAFPVLKDALDDLHFDFTDVLEGESVYDYFHKKNLSDHEIDVIIRKLNRNLSSFIKTGELLPKEHSIEIIKSDVESILEDSGEEE